MPLWDLATRENWELILSDRRIANRLPSPDLTKYKYLYDPISPIYTTPTLYVSPSTSSNLISGVQTSEVKRIGLNRLTLVEFPNYNILPYVLQLEIPYWLEDIYIEVWEYQGAYYGEDEKYENTIVRLESIEEKIDALREDMSITPGQ